MIQAPGIGRKPEQDKVVNLAGNGGFEGGMTSWIADGEFTRIGKDAFGGKGFSDLGLVQKIEQYLYVFNGRYQLEFVHSPSIDDALSVVDVSVVRLEDRLSELEVLSSSTFQGNRNPESGGLSWQYDSVEFTVNGGFDSYSRVLIQFSRGHTWEVSREGSYPRVIFSYSKPLLDEVRLTRLDQPMIDQGIGFGVGRPLEIQISWPAPGEIQMLVSNDLKRWNYWMNPVRSWEEFQTITVSNDWGVNQSFYSFNFEPLVPSEMERSEFQTGGAPMIWLEPGTLVIGSDVNDPDRDNDEGPATKVTLSSRFAMGAYEVTQEQYRAVTGMSPSRLEGREKDPVTNVDWFEAQEFCRRLTSLERLSGRLVPGYEYRLPTEAEWNYACRAGSATRFHYGDDFDYVELESYA